jgi:hypothetical protein
MLQAFHLDAAMPIQVCFKSIMYMLQHSNGCCKGDEILGQERGVTETERGEGWSHGEGRSVARRCASAEASNVPRV